MVAADGSDPTRGEGLAAKVAAAQRPGEGARQGGGEGVGQPLGAGREGLGALRAVGADEALGQVIRERAQWEGNRIGITDQVPPPWTPMTAAMDRSEIP